MKYALTVILAMAGIIMAQIGLTCLFSFQTGETFSKAALTALFFYSILRGYWKRQTA